MQTVYTQLSSPRRRTRSIDLPYPTVPEEADPPSTVTFEEMPEVFHTLKATFEHGDIDREGHEMLFKVLQKMAGIDWFIQCRFVDRTMSWDEAKYRTTNHAAAICMVLNQFKRNYKISLNVIVDALRKLHAYIADGKGFIRAKWLKRLQEMILNLPDPKPRHKHLCRKIADYYFDRTYQKFLHFHRDKPGHKMWQLNECMTAVYLAAEELYSYVAEADEKMQAVRGQKMKMLETLSWYQERIETKSMRSAIDMNVRTPNLVRNPPGGIHRPGKVNEVLAAGDNKPRLAPKSGLGPEHRLESGQRAQIKGIGGSFSAIEEQLSHHRRVTTGTADVAHYTTGNKDSLSVVKPQFGSVAKRKGSSIPRIFTDPFNGLESDLRKLNVGATEAVQKGVIATGSTEPVVSKNLTKEPSSVSALTPLQHPQIDNSCYLSPDDCITKRDLDSDRVPSRRTPIERVRARTFDERVNQLSVWLEEDRNTQRKPEGRSRPKPREPLRHRENTL